MTTREALDEMNRWHARAKLAERALELIEERPSESIVIARNALSARSSA